MPDDAAMPTDETRDLTRSFVEESTELIGRLEDNLLCLKEQPDDRPALEEAFRAVHTIKGNAGFFELDQLNTLAHTFEELLSRIRRGHVPFHSAMLNVMFAASDAMSRLVKQVAEGRSQPLDISRLLHHLEILAGRTTSAVQPTAGVVEARGLTDRPLPAADSSQPPADGLWSSLPSYVARLAHQLGKEADLTIPTCDVSVHRSLAHKLRDVVLHLIRNAVDHGIEPPTIRRQKGKPPQGQITLSAAERDATLVLQLSDDGCGLDADLIKQRALEEGLISAADARSMTDGAALQLVYRSGFTTRTPEQATTISGRGVGLDAVKAAVTRLDGTISISSEPDEGACFTIRIPRQHAISSARTAPPVPTS